MRRRQVLSSGATLLTMSLAGCGHPSNVLDMREATADALSDEMSRTISPDSTGYSAIGEAAENGSAIVSGTSPPVDSDEPIRFQDRYYELSVTEVGSRERRSFDIQVDYNPETTTESETIAYDDLTAVDKTVLDGLIPPEREHLERDGFDMGTRYVPPENETGPSVLVPDQQYEYVRLNESVYRVQVETGTVTEYNYRCSVTEVAASTDMFADDLRSKYQFTLSGLSSDEQEIVEEAIDSGYFNGASDAFRSVVAMLRAYEGLETSDSYGTWLAEYEGAPYITYAEFPPDVTAAAD